MSRVEPLRRCSRCGFLAYRFRECRTCVVLGVDTREATALGGAA